jgi:hypothetical protein
VKGHRAERTRDEVKRGGGRNLFWGRGVCQVLGLTLLDQQHPDEGVLGQPVIRHPRSPTDCKARLGPLGEGVCSPVGDHGPRVARPHHDVVEGLPLLHSRLGRPSERRLPWAADGTGPFIFISQQQGMSLGGGGAWGEVLRGF